MAVLPILRWPDERLEARCAPVAGDVSALVADMLETMYAAPGRGLAAPQVGHLLRLFVMDVTWKEGTRNPVVCINPVITWRSPTRVKGPEGCLSIPGVVADTPRALRVVARGFDEHGEPVTIEGSELLARCIQHETDHLDGMLYLSRLAPDDRKRAMREVRESAWF